MTAKTKAATAAARETTKQIEQAVAADKQTIRKVVTAAEDVGVKAVTVTRETIEVPANGGSAAYRGYEELVQFARDNVNAAVETGLILAKGLQELNRTLLVLTQKQVEENVASAKALGAAKSLQDVIDIQSRFAKNGLDRVIAEGSKLNDASVRLAERALAPLAARLDAVVERAFRAKP